MASDEKIDDLIEHLSLINASTDSLHDSIETLLNNIHTDSEEDSSIDVIDNFKRALAEWSGSPEYLSNPVQFNLIDSITQGIKNYENTKALAKDDVPRQVVDEQSDLSILSDHLADIKSLLAPNTGDSVNTKRDIQAEKSWLSSLFGPGSALLLTGLASLVSAFMDFGGPFTGFLQAWGKWSTMGGMRLLKGAWGGATKMFSVFIKPFKALFGAGTKAAMKTGTKTGLKAIPFVGALFSFGFAVKEAMDGDYFGMSLDIVSGILNLIPTGITQVLSAGLDIFHGFLEYQNITQADPVTGKKPGKGAVFLKMLTDASKGIGEEIMRVIHFLPVVGPVLLAGEAVNHFNEGRHKMGLDSAVRAVSGLIPVVGPTLYEGLNFITSLMDGKDYFSGETLFGGRSKTTPEPEEWKYNPSLREDYYRNDSKSTAPMNPPLFPFGTVPAQPQFMFNDMIPDPVKPVEGTNISGENNQTRPTSWKSISEHLESEWQDKIAQGDKDFLTSKESKQYIDQFASAETKQKYNTWVTEQLVGPTITSLEAQRTANATQSEKISEGLSELIKQNESQAASVKEDNDKIIEALNNIGDVLNVPSSNTVINSTTQASNNTGISENSNYRSDVRSRLGK